MAHYLDLDRWPRRGAFEFFRDYDNPYFNVCAPLDCTALLGYSRANDVSFSLACVYLALKTANACEPFRYRLDGGRVLVHERIHAGTTALLEDERFAFIYFDFDDDFRRVQDAARRARDAARDRPAALEPQDHRTDLLHFSSLPWVEFTSVSHARNWRREDSVPKITFGRYGGSAPVRIPVSVEVHHALMDGLHVGRFLEGLQARFADPARDLDAKLP